MNHQLLSKEEKENNRLGRLQRNKTSKSQKRRAPILDTLSQLNFQFHLAAGLFSCEEGAYVEFAHLARSARILRKMKRNSVLYSCETPTLRSIAETEKLQVERPSRQLHKSRLGPLPCSYTGAELPVPPEKLSKYEAHEIWMNDRSLRSYCRFRVLEFTAKLVGLDIRHTASFAGERLDDGPYTEAEVESLERLQGFQNAFTWGRISKPTSLAVNSKTRKRQ